MVGVNESKELCFLHVTNPINYELLSEATALAQAISLDRIKWLKELVQADDERRSIPVYMKGNEPRKVGLVIDLSTLTQANETSTTAKMSELSLNLAQSGSSLPTKFRGFSIDEITIAEREG